MATPKPPGERPADVPKATIDRLRSEERLRFKNYRMLGSDTQPLLRSYESWAQPLKPSDEVMVRFEAAGATHGKNGDPGSGTMARPQENRENRRPSGRSRPLFVLGPEWRGGRLIIAVALAPERKTGLIIIHEDCMRHLVGPDGLDSGGGPGVQGILKEVHAPADAKTVTVEFEFTNRTDKPVTVAKYDADLFVHVGDDQGRKTPLRTRRIRLDPRGVRHGEFLRHRGQGGRTLARR